MGRYTTAALTKEQYTEIIDMIRNGYYGEDGVLHRKNKQIATILVLEANLGCRIGDIVSMTMESIINDGGVWKLNIIEQKTGKKRCFIIPKPVKRFIDNYAKENQITYGRLFNVSCQAVWKALRQVTEALGYDNISSHSFRKMVAQSIYEKTDYDIEAVCEFLNHSSIATTRNYIRRTDKQLESAINGSVSIV